MARTMRPTFSAALGFRAARSFTFLGVQYEAGDPFDWRKAGCSLRRLQQLYERRRLRMPTDEEIDVSSSVEDMDASPPNPVALVADVVTTKDNVPPKPKKRRGRPPKVKAKAKPMTMNDAGTSLGA